MYIANVPIVTSVTFHNRKTYSTLYTTYIANVHIVTPIQLTPIRLPGFKKFSKIFEREIDEESRMGFRINFIECKLCIPIVMF